MLELTDEVRAFLTSRGVDVASIQEGSVQYDPETSVVTWQGALWVHASDRRPWMKGNTDGE